VWHRAAVRAAR